MEKKNIILSMISVLIFSSILNSSISLVTALADDDLGPGKHWVYCGTPRHKCYWEWNCDTKKFGVADDGYCCPKNTSAEEWNRCVDCHRDPPGSFCITTETPTNTIDNGDAQDPCSNDSTLSIEANSYGLETKQQALSGESDAGTQGCQGISCLAPPGNEIPAVASTGCPYLDKLMKMLAENAPWPEVVRKAIDDLGNVEPGQRKVFFETFASEFQRVTGGGWSYEKYVYPDGGTVFWGDRGNAVVFDSSGNVFTGSITNSNQFPPSGSPNYGNLRQVIPAPMSPIGGK